MYQEVPEEQPLEEAAENTWTQDWIIEFQPWYNV